MPTTRARHMITETDGIRDALDAAARVWPDLEGDRAALLRRLIETGARRLIDEEDERVERKRKAIREVAGSMTGIYPPNAAQLLKEEWPE